MPPKVILVGPMGSGKTTIGQSLASSLGAVFRDTDLVIEEQEVQSIAEIFLDRGEDAFRLLEKEVLRKELLIDDTVLALGGGAPISIDAQAALRSIASPVVYLDVSLATVAPRIGFNRDRPLLLHNPRGQWQTLMEARRPIYQSISNVIIDANDKSENEIVSAILKELAL